jgi:hypothetical protein
MKSRVLRGLRGKYVIDIGTFTMDRRLTPPASMAAATFVHFAISDRIIALNC